MKRVLSVVVAFTLALLTVGCTEQRAPEKEGVQIVLSDDAITVDGTPVTHDETAAVYTANDIVFYLAGQGFTYGAGGEADAHAQTEADAHTVVHIAKPGIYRVSGTLSAGQIAVDLGEGAEEDESDVVTLVLDGADLTCTVAPAIIFYRVYECGSTDAEMASERVDTSAAGANIILADGSTNTINGSYVARIYKSYTLNADGTEVIDNKKLHKYDGALYSKMSMNVSGESDGSGILNINAENEGLDSELHLTVNSGNVNIVSGNDGINTNEDGISVTTINGGAVSICVSGATGEGDGIDSNGYLVINGGTVVVSACADSEDAGIDSDCGIYLNGGTVIASGNMLDAIAGGVQNYAVFTFAQQQRGGTVYTLKNADGAAVLTAAPENAFRNFVISAPELTPGDYTLWCGDTQLAHGGTGAAMPHGFDGELHDGQLPQPPEGMEPAQQDGKRREAPEDERPPLLDGEGEERQAGERPPLPDGMPQPPQDLSFPGEGNEMGERTETFSIVRGGSQFTGIAEKK